MIIRKLIFALFILSLVTLACETTTSAPPATPDMEDLQLAVQQTLDYEKAVDAQLTQAAVQDQPPTETVNPPTQESSPTVTVTSSVPLLSVSMDTNCREGPDANIWKAIGAVLVGQKTEIVAKYDKGHWYIVKNPSNPNERCWVFDFYATIEGDTSTLPKATIPPTPTPKP
ncbi:MAG: hypothetical protein JW704_05485 [Anaerolineaceae bacterium]|nr:hypothetical protein [Anaerolineaceae bacterium]